MTKPINAVLADALRLDDHARAELVAALLASLDGPADLEAEQAWDAETERRRARGRKDAPRALDRATPSHRARRARPVKPFQFSAPAAEELVAAIRWY